MHHPFVYFPAFYLLKGAAEGRPAGASLAACRAELWDNCKALWMIWVPAQTVNFTVVPRHLRIPYVAGVSFVWTVVLSVSRGALQSAAAPTTAAISSAVGSVAGAVAGAAAPPALAEAPAGSSGSGDGAGGECGPLPQQQQSAVVASALGSAAAAAVASGAGSSTGSGSGGADAAPRGLRALVAPPDSGAPR